MLCSGVVRADTFDKGFAAYKVGNYAEASKIFNLLAAKGNASAQFNLGLMYYNRQGVPSDYKKAADLSSLLLVELIGIRSNAKAQYNLGYMYDNGVGVGQDYQEAAKWYLSAAARGNASAQSNLGLLYHKGLGVSKDFGEALNGISSQPLREMRSHS